MPSFDMRISFLDRTWHAVGSAENLDALPLEVAKRLVTRISEIMGADQHKPSDPELENKVSRLVSIIESSSGALDHATVNAVRKEMGTAPVTRAEAKEKKASKAKAKQ